MDDAHVPDLETLSYGGAFALAQIPNIDWGRISANFPETIAELLSDHDLARHPLSIIPTMDDAHVPDVETLSYTNPFAVAQIPNLLASKITSERFPMARMPDGTLNYVLTAQGAEVNPAYAEAPAPSANAILERIQKFKGVFWWNNNWVPSGMIGNATSGTGLISWYEYVVVLDTGTTSDSYAFVIKMVSPPVPYTWDKKRYFCVKGLILMYSAQYIHIVTGNISSYSASANTERHVGFKVVDNVLYGTVGNGTAESTLEIETLTETVSRILEVAFTPGVEARFYVDGVDKGAITTNLPSGTTHAEYLFFTSVYNTEAVNKSLRIMEVRAMQEE